MPATTQELSLSEVRRTISTSLAAAFGFVIALLWKEIVVGALAVGGITLGPEEGLAGLAIFVGTAIALTVAMVVLIVLVSRWGGKA